MASKLLQGIGVVALVALVGGSLAALALVKQRLEITITEAGDAAQRGPDPLELLRADVAELRGDVAALTEGTGTQLEALHGALESSSDERQQVLSTEIARLEAQLTALQIRVDRSPGELESLRHGLERRLDLLTARIDDAAAAARTEVEPPPPADLAAETPVLPPPVEIPVVTDPTPARAEPAPEKKKGFLSFKLPSQSFAFDQRQRLNIVASLSRVGFDAKSTLHDFSGVTQKLVGELRVNLARPADGVEGSIEVEASSLDTGLVDRDAEMRKVLDTAKHTRLRFEWTAFDVEALDATSMTLNGTARGKLTIKGTARDVAMPVHVSVDASKRVHVDGELSIKLSDFGVKPPSQLGVISVDDQVKVWVALQARSLGAVEDKQP
jgi:polyisoprenoid-binding protein YceI